MRIDVYIHRSDTDRKLDELTRLVRALAAKEAFDMSKLSDKIKAANDEADAAITRVQADVQALKDKIAALEEAGPTTQADLDSLDALKAKLAALDPTDASTLPA